MNLISLGCEKDPLKQPQRPCHLLDINQTCVLLECPLDLSASSLFLPVLQSPSQQTILHSRKRKGNVLQKRICVEEETESISSLFKEIHGQVLAHGVHPWYKAAALELVDVGLLDAVIVSSPCGMLGLPFLTKHPDFHAQVYASKATADLGRIMMEELVVMHSESHGSLKNAEQKPPWLDPSVLATLPVHMRGSSLGRCFSNRANWHPLYSLQDIRDSLVHVHKLRFGEEINVNGSLRVSPSSSGMGLGSSNWLLSGASPTVGYMAASLLTKSHAMALDKAALTGCHALIVSDVQKVEASSTSGSGTAVESVVEACKGAVEAVKRGGSVLVPVSPGGVLLEHLEELGGQLAAANLKHIPIHYISSAAEEMLAYCNTVPEWLCHARQEKLYAGEPLFGYVDLVQEGRLRHSKAFSSPELQKTWQEPCVVFAAHCSLRLGPAVHLLNRWRQNPLCLLILTERESEKDLLLAPYMPLSMQVLELRASLRLRSEEVTSLLQSIRPQVALVPDFLQVPGTTGTIPYHHKESVQVPTFHTDFEVDMTAELALQVQPKLVKPKKLAAAPFQANFTCRDGKLCLQTAASDGDYQFRYGPVNIAALTRALQERGIGEVVFHDPAGVGNALVVEIRSPSRAWIELGVDTSCVKANDASVRGLIADAINSVLQVL